MRLSPARTLAVVAVLILTAPVQVDAASAAARATNERSRSSPAKIPSSASSKTEAKQHISQQFNSYTAPASANHKLDPSDPGFQAAAAKIQTHILTKVEDIVAGLQSCKEALRGLQDATNKDDVELQTTIAQALTKVERALYGASSSIGKQKNGGTSTGMYSHALPPENWVTVSNTMLANHTRTVPIPRTTA